MWALSGVPLVESGDDLPEIVLDAATRTGLILEDGDVIVLAQKIVSKSEGRSIELSGIVPTQEAERLAAVCDKDPRLVQAILDESLRVLRCRPGVIIVRHRLGHVLANAGIDQSNVAQGESGERILLLPFDPDGSAAKVRGALERATGIRLGVVIIDSLGRAWRLGTCGTCLGVSGLAPLHDLRGRPDLFGRPLQTTTVGFGDEIAAAASMLMGQSNEGAPIVIVRGLDLAAGRGAATDLLRPEAEDLFL